jgi:uncharacterized membrane protein HdeD (DUF308 family)
MKIGTNPNRRIALNCIWIIVAGILLMILPGFAGMEGINGGYALGLFGGFVAIVGIITVIIYWRLARLQDTILDEKSILIHWTYSPSEWQQYVEKEHIEDKSDKKNLFFLVAGISIIAGIILFFIYPDSRLVTLFTILGIIVVIGITALLSSWAVNRWNKKNSGEIYIAQNGAYFSGRLHIWRGLGTKLTDIKFEDTPNSNRIVVSYSSPNYLTNNFYTVRIPVPQGQEAAARKVVSEIRQFHLAQNK